MPGDRDLSLVYDEAELADYENRQAELRVRIDRCNRMIGMFQNKGWKELEKDLVDELNAATQTLISDKLNTMESIAFVRGQMRALEFLVRLPEHKKLERDMAQLELAELRAAEVE